MFAQSYAMMVKLSKDAIRDTMAPLRAREMEMRGRAELAKLNSQVAEAEQKTAELASAYPIDYDKLIGAMDNSALLRRKAEQLELIISGLFPAATAGEPAKG